MDIFWNHTVTIVLLRRPACAKDPTTLDCNPENSAKKVIYQVLERKQSTTKHKHNTGDLYIQYIVIIILFTLSTNNTYRTLFPGSLTIPEDEACLYRIYSIKCLWDLFQT